MDKWEYLLLTCRYGEDCTLRSPDGITRKIKGCSSVILSNFVEAGWKISGNTKQENGLEEWSLRRKIQEERN